MALLATATSASSLALLPGSAGFDVNVYAWDRDTGKVSLAKQAGSHPDALSFSVNFATEGGGPFTEGDLRNLSLEMPPGLIVSPTALGKCTLEQFSTPRQSPFETSLSGEGCPDKSQAGTVTLHSSFGGGETRTFGLFNLEPPPGAPFELGFNPYGHPIFLLPSIRQADGEYAVTLLAKNVTQALNVSGMTVTIWGVPWGLLEKEEPTPDPPPFGFQHLIRHEKERGNCLNEKKPVAFFGEPGRVLLIPKSLGEKTDIEKFFDPGPCSAYNPLSESLHAFLTLPTSCEEPLDFELQVESWDPVEAQPEPRRTQGKPSLQGCAGLAFEPKVQAHLSDPRASSPSGYTFDIDVDTTGVTDPGCCAPTPVRKAVVTLPQGVTINPSVGSGLGVCTPAQYAAETVTSPPGAGCPNNSKVGDFTVKTPIVEQVIDGAIFLAEPYRNPFGKLISLYLVAKSIERGVLVKVAGELNPDPGTGTLTATFDKLPQLPYFQLSIHFREGQRSPLATPAACGSFSTEADLTPWRDPNLIKHHSLPLSITAGVGGGPCPSGLAPFAPGAQGGTLNSNAGSYTPFYLHLTRQATEQEIVSYSAELPPGLLGKIAGIPYCPDAAIEAAMHRSGVAERDNPSCPAASLIGHTYSGYGVGSVLAYAPGNLYLAGPYRGSSFSVVAIDSALVGPFDLGVVVVRSAIRIDPQTAQASIDATGTDPIPHIVNGIPIHLRDVRAYIDRPKFIVNPTSCEPFSLASALNGAGQRFADRSDDTLVIATAPFRVLFCDELGFKPRISLNLKGGTKRGRHPSLRVVVKPRRGDANISGAKVALPDSLFLDQDNIEGICSKTQFAADQCPPGSVYGRVRAFTPLLAEPMQGPVYLRSSDNPLPDLVFALRGQGIKINLAGKVDSVRGGLRGSFDALPDAPVTKFVMRLNGGKRGILVVAVKDFCSKSQFANARFIGHNNRGWVSHPEMGAKCAKKQRRRRR